MSGLTCKFQFESCVSDMRVRFWVHAHTQKHEIVNKIEKLWHSENTQTPLVSKRFYKQMAATLCFIIKRLCGYFPTAVKTRCCAFQSSNNENCSCYASHMEIDMHAGNHLYFLNRLDLRTNTALNRFMGYTKTISQITLQKPAVETKRHKWAIDSQV